MRTLSGRAPSQREDELKAFIELLLEHEVRSYLEIGARHGDTFYEVVRSLPQGSRGVAVDLPGAKWGQAESAESLRLAVCRLCDLGYRASCIFGDSAEESTVKAVQGGGPYDAVLIDGDHSYEAVRRDWLTYGDARLVAFHDIDGEGYSSRQGDAVEVPRLWSEIKRVRKHTEIIGRERGMGIGVIHAI